MFVDAQTSSTFYARTFEKKPKFRENVVIGQRHYSKVDSSKTSSLSNTIIQKWNVSRYFWMMALPSDDVFGELCAFFQNIFPQNILNKRRNVSQKRYIYFWINVLPNDDISVKLCFFSKYFSPKYFFLKKGHIPWKRHLYFWIMMLPNDDIFGELCGFFFEIFFSEISKCHNCTLESIIFCSNQMRAKIYFLLNYWQQPDHVHSFTMLRIVAQCSTNFCFHQLHRT